MEKVLYYGCYDFNKDWYLVEMMVDDSSDDVDFYEFLVPEQGLDENDWQCAYLEQFLNKKGTKKICKTYDEPDPGVKPCRAVFFIFKNAPKILRTPYGDFPLGSSPMPERLKGIIEFEED